MPRKSNPQQYEVLDVLKYRPFLAQESYTKMSPPQRAAHYLDWAATNYPKQYTQYTHLVKAIYGYGRMPRVDSQEVVSLRHAMSRIRQILIEKFGRQLDTKPGLGVRATVDSLDVARNTMPREIMKVRRAQAAAARTYSLINKNAIPKTPETEHILEWLNKDVRDVMKTLNSPEFQARLSLPQPAEAKKKA